MVSTITVRNVDDATKRAIKHRAVNHGRSFEAEIRAILRTVASESGRNDLALPSTLVQAATAFRASVDDIDFTMPPRMDDQPREVFS